MTQIEKVMQTIGSRKMIVVICAIIAICFVVQVASKNTSGQDGIYVYALISIVSLGLGQNLFQFFIDKKK
jgi:hypothetical protein